MPWSEFERNLIRERTRASLQAECARGRKGGRPKALDRDKRDLVVKLYDVKRNTIIEDMRDDAHFQADIVKVCRRN